MIKTTNFRVSRLQKIQPLLDLNLLNASAILAGGSLQTLIDPTIAVNDYDLFFTDESVAKLTKRRLDVLGEKVFECPQGALTTYKVVRGGQTIKIQLITKFIYTSMEALLDTFDFCASMFAYDGRQLITTRTAIRDTRNKHVNLNRVTYPVATLNRMIKYAARKGFTVTHDALRFFVREVNQSSFDDDQMVLYID